MVLDAELSWIAETTGALQVRRGARIQPLWSGYGELFRVHLTGAATPSAVVKSVNPPARAQRSTSDASDQRKRRSYDIEATFYVSYSARCDASCRVPEFLGLRKAGERRALLLEDLDSAGFWGRRRMLAPFEIERCLAWLAAFHARFLGTEPAGLWPIGTYWHLNTRTDELAVVPDPGLRDAAPILDQKLANCAFQTLVHGDAKLANFCFSENDDSIAALDFQYVGAGCGMKDVAYFLSSCSSGGEEVLDSRYLDTYFSVLRERLNNRSRAIDTALLEQEWRTLYPIACADFYRFLAGWAPSEWRVDSVARSIVRQVLRTL